MEGKEDFNLKEHYDSMKNHSVGEFGFVKSGICKNTGLAHSIKIIKKGKVDESTLERKISQLEKLKEFESLYISRIYEIVNTKKKLYIISELLEGVELQKKVLSEGKLSESLAIELIKQVTEALLYYLKNECLFTDLRCEKIIYLNNHNTKVKLVDNGSSRPYPKGGLSALEVKESTPKDLLYMAPEILQDQLFPESLSWSVGMIFYFLISGVFPFDGPNDARINNLGQDLFHEKSWEVVRTGCKDAIRDLLKKDYHDRLKLDSLTQRLDSIEVEADKDSPRRNNISGKNL